MGAEINRSKRLTIVHGFWPESEKFDFGKQDIIGHSLCSQVVDDEGGDTEWDTVRAQ